MVKPLLALALAAAATSTVARPTSENAARWQPLIDEAARRFAIPEIWIVRVIAAESGGRIELERRPIRSLSGAIGLMQLMPRTWAAMRAAYGLGRNPDDPHDNIIAGTAYLRLMFDRFGYPGLFAAYNAGPTRYAAYLAGRSRLPAETMAYLSTVAGPERGAKSVRVMPPEQLLFALRHDLAGASGTAAQPGTGIVIFALRKAIP